MWFDINLLKSFNFLKPCTTSLQINRGLLFIFSPQHLKESQNTVNQKQKSISIIEVRIQLFGWSDRLFLDYLLAEAERKKREKQEAIEREKAEDLKAEAKFLRQQEQLRQEAEQEKLRKIEEDRVSS